MKVATFIKICLFSYVNSPLYIGYSYTIIQKWLEEFEIRFYMKNPCILGIGCKDIFEEICSLNGQNEISFSLIIRRVNKIKCGFISTEEASH
jgi:hypothetical protein